MVEINVLKVVALQIAESPVPTVTAAELWQPPVM